MGGFSLIHWIILGLFLLLLFGGSRFSNMMKDVAKGMKSFKQGMADEDDDKVRRYDEQRRSDPPRQISRDESRPQEPIDVTPRAADPASPPPEKTSTAKPASAPDVRRRFHGISYRRSPRADLHRPQGLAK